MSTSRVRTWLVTAALMAGATVGAAGIANAASGGSTSTGSSSSGGVAAQPQLANPATMTHGPGETLLTGSTAVKVKQAALAAVPGATVIRVETDSAGAAYEAHLTKADGTQVTAKLNSAFKVTGMESGFGAPPSH